MLLTPDPTPTRSITPVQPSTLEIELMHRWSTVTFKSLVTPAIADEEIWQKSVPKVALKVDFLMNGILALAACEMACSSPAEGWEKYANAAFEFQDHAFRSYQAHIRNLNADNQDGVLYFSLMLLELTMASSRLASLTGEVESKVQRVLQFHDLVRGANFVMVNHSDRLRVYPEFQKVTPLSTLPEVSLDPSVEAAIANLTALNEDRAAYSLDAPAEMRFRSVMCEGACKKAIFWLKECFARCDNAKYRMWPLGWISMSGDDYIKAIKHGDQVALLTLMCWAVLIQPLGTDYWWARGFGKSLIDEILGSIPEGVDLRMRAVIYWARDRVAMEEMTNAVWSSW